MKYLDLTTCSVADGKGFRLVLWCAGCEHRCEECHNQQSWDLDNGIDFTEDTWNKLCEELSKDYISGITLSGGDPMHHDNIQDVYKLCKDIKNIFPNKTIWLYTGYTFEEIWIPNGYFITQDVNPARDCRNGVLRYIDVLVDGKFAKDLKDITLPFRGSTNQRVIDVQKTLRKQEVVLFEE